MALGIGIVSTGRIARMHAQALRMTDKAKLVAVSSRKLETATAFTGEFGGAPVEGVKALLTTPGVEAVYIASPTGAKEDIALEAIRAGKHVWIEKPLISESSAERLSTAAEHAGVAIMDATHFTHNPRTERIREQLSEEVGTPLSMHTSFFANVGDRSNIRFDAALEPQGALGDLGWYCARAAVEYLGDRGAPRRVAAAGTWADQALVAVSALLVWSDGKRMTMDCGFIGGAFAQDLTIMGTEGSLHMDDFIHDWEKGRIQEMRPQFPSGYRVKKGRSEPEATRFQPTPSEKSHVIHLIENFARLAADPRSNGNKAARRRMIATQSILDAVFAAAC